MNNGNIPEVTTDDSSSFKYKSSLLKDLTATNVTAVGSVAAHRIFHNAKIAVRLKYVSNFLRSLEMLLINCKIHLELNWSKNCVMSTTANTTFQITSTNFMFQLSIYQLKIM